MLEKKRAKWLNSPGLWVSWATSVGKLNHHNNQWDFGNQKIIFWNWFIHGKSETHNCNNTLIQTGILKLFPTTFLMNSELYFITWLFPMFNSPNRSTLLHVYYVTWFWFITIEWDPIKVTIINKIFRLLDTLSLISSLNT